LAQISLSKYAIERGFNRPPHLFIVVPYLGKLQDPKYHEFSLKLQISIMVSIAVSKMGMTEFIFVVPGMKVNGQYCCDVLLSQQMLPAI